MANMGVDVPESQRQFADIRCERDEAVTVLCVDDNPRFLDLSAEFLAVEMEADGVTVRTETDPTEALDCLTAGTSVDCIVADYDMPEMTGVELLKEAREVGYDRPFLLFTGKGSEAVASEAISAGATDYIRKEGTSDQFAVVANRIEEAISQYRAEQRLRRREFLFRRLVSTAPAPITMYDETGEYVYANPPAAEFFGYQCSDQLVGKSKFDVTSPAEHGNIERRLGDLADGNQIPPSEHVYVTADGARKTGVASCTPAIPFDAAGITIIRETTDTEQATRLGDLAETLSHDLESSLLTVEGRVDLARDTGDVTHLSAVDEALASVRSHVDDVVEVLRNEQFETDVEPVDLPHSCRDAWTAVDVESASLSVPGECTIQADKTGLRRMLENLFHNAVEHGGEGVHVRVETTSDGFFVADDGQPIPEERRDAVFLPGYSTTDGGSGLGLTSVKQIALAHDWDVRVTESSRGGTRFEILGVGFAG